MVSRDGQDGDSWGGGSTSRVGLHKLSQGTEFFAEFTDAFGHAGDT